MRKLLVLVPFLLLLACNSGTNKIIFTPDILAKQLFTIDATKDTSIETLHGAIIRISRDAFTVSGQIDMEIKEAFTPAEIFAAGLATESNGKPLRSGGMIYINASAGGKSVELLKPINISIPNSYYDSSMQVFKGVETDTGINWVDPVHVDSTPQSAKWLAGKAFFESKCRSCHSIFKNMTGPALAHVEERGPWADRKKIYDYVRNPPAFMAKDPYSRNLRMQYGSGMTGFPYVSESALDDLLDYIKNESKRPGAYEEENNYIDSLDRPDTANSGNFLIEDPCRDDTIYLPIPRNETAFFDTVSFEAPAVADTLPINKPLRAEDVEGFRKGFTDPNPTNGMYDFSIKTLGWFNVDAYVEGYAGTANVKLWARLEMNVESDMHVYLFCPEKKMLSIGNVQDGKKYFFDKINEGIPLFINDRAILFAFGSKGDKMFYGITEFFIREEQTIGITIKETTEEELKSAIQAKQLEGIDIGIEKKEKLIIRNPCNEKPGTDTIGTEGQSDIR